MEELLYEEDVLCEEQRLDELTFIQDYFIQHVYNLRIKMSDTRYITNHKQGDKYMIEIGLKKNNAILRLEIPIENYKKVNAVVAFRDINELTFEQVAKEVK